ncbi:MAG: triose-phosphate isomerase [Firmicutes bacterium]|nr:triose-phosphate isomerase [Bacillota bacterium]
MSTASTPTRTPVIAGNWKMNNTVKETETLLKELIPLVEGASAAVVVCVPFTDIKRAAQLTKRTNIAVGAQNVAWADKGAFTGEISADMLKEAGAKYVIIGHSERRQYFGETDVTVNKRLKQALSKGLTAIVCVGETLLEREGGITEQVVKAQIEGGFKDITAAQTKKVIVAYEPVWAIGTGKTASAKDAQDTIAFIRGVLKKRFGAVSGEKLRIQYGGSMNAQNVDELMAQPDIDGGLIGGASLKAADFARIVKFKA